jgi:hypothetical protein
LEGSYLISVAFLSVDPVFAEGLIFVVGEVVKLLVGETQL